MPGKHLYEYAIIRFVPQVERGEFINIGVILFSKRAGYIAIRHYINEEKIRVFAPEADVELLRRALHTYCEVAAGTAQHSPIARFEVPDRFRWLTAVKSSCLQTSETHSGFSDDLDKTLDRLFKELVL